MHLVEQLRIKRTDAQNHLLGRKRKLAELFTITAWSGDGSLTTKSQNYLQQLQAFQDANDLQKGRLFDQSTLPARVQITYQPQHVSTQTSQSDTLYDSKELRLSRTPPTNDKIIHSHASEAGAKFYGSSTAGVDGRTDNSKSKLLPPEQLRKGVKGDNLTLKTQATTLVDESTETDHVFSTSPTTQSRLTNNRINGTEFSTHEADNSKKSVPIVPHPPPAGPQSSPASTNGPGLPDTPAPTTDSPTTSLGEIVSPPSTVLNTEKPTDQEPSQITPQTPSADLTQPVHKMSVSSVDVDVLDADPSAAFESPVQSSAPHIKIPGDTPSRPKPPIRVNTQHHLGPNFRPQAITSGAFVETPAPITGTDTPHQQSSTVAGSTFDSSRRATRISSGALQKKSVSEILGETPKPASPYFSTPVSSTTKEAFHSATSQLRQADRERKEKERNKLSTVVFAKPQRPLTTESDTIEMTENSQIDLPKMNTQDRDYLYTLFESKAYSSKQGNLSHLIQHAHKTITTADHLVDYEYQAQCRVLKRLYQLQSAERWALRQRKRADEPARQTSHWDFLLDHAKWMRTDFREERKWKLAAARGLAECCAEWVMSSPEERKRLQVQVRSSKTGAASGEDSDVMMDEEVLVSLHPTPELLPSGEDDSVSESIADPRDIALSAAPAAIFSLGASDFNFMADRTPAFDKLINELPLYEPAKIEPDLAKSDLAERRDARWKTDIVPVSRYATERIRVKEYKPPFKRSRYDYELETSPSQKTVELPPRDINVGLFMPENKHIRDRIHPGHSFRPPSEHPMPTQSFFETRTSSQWTPTEDDELRKLVKDYSYNWSLISSCLTPKCLYTSSPDRRTPWECFERWIGLEGMPADMAKTPYFRTYSGRIEAAGRHLQAQLEEAQRRAGPNVPISSRKRTTQPVRVERKRAQRHLAMLDAMRKLAKKRETMRQKQAHSSEVAAMRKASEVNQHTKPPLRTPAEFSAMKHEREQKMAKQHELYRQQLIAHQRAASAQQQRGPNGQINGVPNGVPQPANQPRGPPNGLPAPAPNGQLQVPNGIPRPHPAMMGVQNGMPMPAGMAGQKAIQAQIQANMRNGMGGSPQQIRMHQEQMIRQAQQNGNHSSPNSGLANMSNGQNAGFMQDMNGVNGQPSPSAAISGNAGSPRQAGLGALSNGHVPVLNQIAANIKQRHPNMSDDDIQRAASQQLTTWQQQATAAAAGQVQRPRVNQAALNAAMGAANAAAHAGNVAAAQAAQAAALANGGFPQGQAMMTTEQLQQYNQRMRMQQAQQHAARGMQGQMPMAAQVTNSPMVAMARPVSQHNTQQQGMSRSATPNQRSGSLSNVPMAATPSANGGNTTPVNSSTSAQGQQPSPVRPAGQQAMQA